MSEQDILIILEAIQKKLIDIEETLSRLPKRKLPLPAGYNPMGKKKCLSQRLRGGLMDSEIRAAIMRLKKEGKQFKYIAAYIKAHWPGQPEKHPSRSTIHRFYQAAQNGRLREFGIEPPVKL